MKALLFFLLAGLLNAGEVKVGPLNFTVEEPWLMKPGRGMVKASARHGDSGPLLKFYYFGKGQGGSVAANLERWKGQFQGDKDVKEEVLEIGGRSVSLLTVRGTYLAGPPMGKKTPIQGQMMLGAVIPDAAGPVFLKMTGDEEAMLLAEENFRRLLRSLEKS